MQSWVFVGNMNGVGVRWCCEDSDTGKTEGDAEILVSTVVFLKEMMQRVETAGNKITGGEQAG